MVGLAASRFLKASSERRYDSVPGQPIQAHVCSAPGRLVVSSARAGELGDE